MLRIKFDEDLFRRILHNILQFFLDTGQIELNFQQCHWEQNSAVIMAPNFANTTPSYANASLHPISKITSQPNFITKPPMEWCYLRFLKNAHQLSKLDIEALSQKMAAHTGICNN